MKENERVTTAIRWRLPADENNELTLEKIHDNVLSFRKQSSQRQVYYTFDHVINASDQKKVYEILVEPLVEKSLEGYDCTLLASGQTGSGKTYTMGFESSSSINAENSGMAPRALHHIFSCGLAVQVYISFFEVYNNQAFDLLGKNPQEPFYKKDHRVREPTKELVRNEHEAYAILTLGTKQRRVRGTKMNSTSSRSHAVFTIFIRTESGEHTKRESVINLVDLAGSECVRKTGTTGKAHAEGKSINGSLEAFKRVFAAMSGRGGVNYIPYRDSLITYILRDSLKIDCYLTLLGCVSPLQGEHSETSSMLQFVAEAKQIKRIPQVNAVINGFQKSHTPVKASHQLSNLSLRSMKQPSPSIAKESLSSRSRSSMSDQRRQSTHGNATAQRRFTRHSISNSTAKRATLSAIRNMRINSVGAKSVQLMTSRKTLETAMRSEEPINWNEASPSSAIDGDYHGLDSSHQVRTIQQPIFPPDNEDVLRIVKSLENVINEEMTGDKGITRAAIADMIGQLKLKLNDPSLDVSFCAASPSTASSIQCTMLSTVAEVSEAVSEKRIDNDESNANLISSSCLGTEPDIVADQIALISSVNDPINDSDSAVKVSINYDHTKNKILFSVEEKSSDSTTVHSETRNTVEPNTNQRETVTQSFLETANAQRESSRPSEESIEAMVSSTTIINSPKVSKRMPAENVRTPIGKLIIRKVAPACDFDSTQYTVEMINRARHPLQVPMDYSEFCVTPTHTSNQFRMSTAIKRNPRRSVDRRPLSPRIILHRIGSLQQFRMYQPSKRQAETKTKSKAQRAKITRTVEIGEMSKKTDRRQQILEILNTGSEKDLQKLSKIGKKTSAQILIYRNDKGPFKSIEELTKIGWSTTMCQKFIKANVFE